MKHIILIILICVALSFFIDSAPQKYNNCSFEYVIEEIEQYNSELNIISAKIQQLHPRFDPPNKLLVAIHKYSNKYNLDEDLIIAVIYTESSFRKNAVSRVDCVGYMQIHWRVHRLDRGKMFNTYNNIQKGSEYLSYLYNRYNSLERALNRYNGWDSPYNTFGRTVINRMNRISNI